MLKYFLGVEVMRSKLGILLSQRKYVLDFLSETGKLSAKPCSTPMTPNVLITKEIGWEIELSCSNSPGYFLFSKCFESVYVISHSKSLGSCRAYPMLFERSFWTWNIV